MTREEWKIRCAARFAEKAPWLTAEQCAEAAQMCFDAESCEGDFSELAEYFPEDVADEEMSGWADDEG